MDDKTYRITLKTIGPVHIGSGRSLSKNEYIKDSEQGLVHVVDGKKLIKFLKRKNLFKNYLSEIENKHNFSLFNYLNGKNHKIKKTDWNVFTENSIKYYEAINRRLNTINTFIRDGRNDRYIPGSSVKGALRTAISLSENSDTIKKMFSNIIVHDSSPIEDKDFFIYQKIDVNKKEEGRPLFRECIDANQEVHTYITIKDNAISIEEIQKKISEFYKHYYEKWMYGFRETDGGKHVFDKGAIPEVRPSNATSQIIFLGGGVGIADKTTFYQEYSREQARSKLYDLLSTNHSFHYKKNRKNRPKNIPIILKTTRNTTQVFLQGACLISFEEV